jgi:hypothetical protein
MFEVGIDHAVWEALSANAYTLEHAVARQLIQYEICVDDSLKKPFRESPSPIFTRFFQLIWNDASNEMRMSIVEHVHEVI